MPLLALHDVSLTLDGPGCRLAKSRLLSLTNPLSRFLPVPTAAIVESPRLRAAAVVSGNQPTHLSRA
jgi:hypothetical protein